MRKFSRNCPYINFLSKVEGLILRFMSFIVYFATSFVHFDALNITTVIADNWIVSGPNAFFSRFQILEV